MNPNVRLWGSLLMLVLLLFWALEPIYDQIKLERNPRYTIGITSGWVRTAKGPEGHFTFEVDGKIYQGRFSFQESYVNVDGARYYVMFLLSDPGICQLLLNAPVPSEIRESPPQGWDEIPKSK